MSSSAAVSRTWGRSTEKTRGALGRGKSAEGRVVQGQRGVGLPQEGLELIGRAGSDRRFAPKARSWQTLARNRARVSRTIGIFLMERSRTATPRQRETNKGEQRGRRGVQEGRSVTERYWY